MKVRVPRGANLSASTVLRGSVSQQVNLIAEERSELQNKQIPTFSAFTHRPQSSRACCVDKNLQQKSRLANFKMSFLTAAVNYN